MEVEDIKKGLLFVSILMIVLFLVFTIVKLTKPNHVYFIPNDFEGEVEIRYNQPNGVEINSINRRVLFYIPVSGVLSVSNTEPEYGWRDVNYYYVNKQNKIIKELFVNQEIFDVRQEKSGGSTRKLFTVNNSGR